MAMRLTDEQLDWLADRVPEAPVSPKGGRPATNKRDALRGIFWILDNGAKWKDLPRRFGSKSAVHRWFTLWVREGVFERIMRDAGELVEERGGFRLYECFVDATFSKAKAAGTGRRPMTTCRPSTTSSAAATAPTSPVWGSLAAGSRTPTTRTWCSRTTSTTAFPKSSWCAPRTSTGSSGTSIPARRSGPCSTCQFLRKRRQAPDLQLQLPVRGASFDGGAKGNRITQEGGQFGLYGMPGTANLGGRKFSDVAFASSKVMAYDSVQRHLGKVQTHYAYDDVRTTTEPAAP